MIDVYLQGNPTSCVDASKTSCGTCGQDCEYCGSPFSTSTAPTYHLMDQFGCAENDPNGPVFDPVHGVIHHFYQAHVAMPGGKGPVYGHFVSKDFVNWASLPNAIWNGYDYGTNTKTLYDGNAIYTGSAVVVDGAAPDGVSKGIVQIYPGLCLGSQWPDCNTGTLIAQAVPAAYADDPLLEVWTKPDYNPIINNTQRDPSTPWKTSTGQWRMRTYDSKIYAADSDNDLLNGKWYELGKSTTLRQCECPSLYPLPRVTPGFEPDDDAFEEEHPHKAEMASSEKKVKSESWPTHVHKTSCSGDWWQLGNYVENGADEVGTFSATPGWEDLFSQRKMDMGNFYASKDQLYPSLDGPERRINWGWAQVNPSSTQTLPREITFNPMARMLEQAPLPELQMLREATITMPSMFPDVTVLALPSRHSEIVASFKLQSEVSLEVGECATCTLKLADGTVNAQCGSFKDSYPIVPDRESSLDVQIFADATFLEVFLQGGRVAMTVKCGNGVLADDAPLTVSGDVTSLDVYSLRSIWVTPDDVRDAPRVYN